MPIYRYRCRECGREFEHFHRRASEPPPRCPQCDGGDLAKIPAAFAVGASQRSEAGATACCGLNSPCSNPRRCCEA